METTIMAIAGWMSFITGRGRKSYYCAIEATFNLRPYREFSTLYYKALHDRINPIVPKGINLEPGKLPSLLHFAGGDPSGRVQNAQPPNNQSPAQAFANSPVLGFPVPTLYE